MDRKAHLFLSICILLLLTSIASAQGVGTIFGTVTDPSGAAIPGAKVAATLIQRGTTRTVNASVQGEYVLPLMPIGTYSISVEATGFKLFTRQSVTLTANQNVQVDARLELGATTESVTVSAEAPLVDSRSSTVGALVDSRRVVDLPINGRNVVSLAAILPGVTSIDAPQTFVGDRTGPTLSVAGSHQNENLFLFNGVHFNALFRNTGLSYPPPDAIQEVKVLVNSFSAEYGRNTGSVFNVVTKSGTNELHGAAWEFLRNQHLNARNFFASSTKPKLIQNQFGAAAGGPIQKNKLFIFGVYEALRIRPNALSTSAFPLTAAERIGDFSASSKPVLDPLNGQPFTNNQISPSRIDPVASNIFSRNLMPLPNQPDGQLVTTFPTPQNNSNAFGRLDYNWNRHTIDAHYSYNNAKSRSSRGDVPTYLPFDNGALTHSVTLADTFVIRPSLLNQLRLGYNRTKTTITSLNPVSLGDLGANFPSLGPKVPPALSISGRLSLGSSSIDQVTINEGQQILEAISWTRNTHTVKAGFQLLRFKYLARSFFQTEGEFNFTGGISGNAAADFFLGKPARLNLSSYREHDGQQTNTYSYVQDDWRVHPRLTLNLGLRYEVSPPWITPHDNIGTLHFGQQSTVMPSAPLGMVFPGDAGVPRGLVPTDKNNFAPRFGFAWDPFGNGRTSIRGAYGIFYESLNADMILIFGQPFLVVTTVNAPYSLSDPLRGLPPIPLTFDRAHPVFVGVPDVQYPDPTLRSPYVQQVNFGVQRQITTDLAIEVGYFSKIGRKLRMPLSANPAVYGPGATLANTNQRRIWQGFGDNTIISTLGNSSYNALQVQVNKRYSRNFSMQGAYTFSRSLDIYSAYFEGGATPNVFDLRTEYGLSDFNSKHLVSLSWIYDLPRLTSAGRFVRGLAGGWQVNGFVVGRSGRPINVLVGSDVALSATPNQRPNVVGNPYFPGDRSRAEKILAWFDRTAFAAPAKGTFGNTGRNALLGPASASTNVGLFKDFGVPGREGLRLQFRSEFFNIFNSVNLSNPNASLTAGKNMGRITSAGDARVIQFALKFLF